MLSGNCDVAVYPRSKVQKDREQAMEYPLLLHSLVACSFGHDLKLIMYKALK